MESGMLIVTQVEKSEWILAIDLEKWIDRGFGGLGGRCHDNARSDDTCGSSHMDATWK
jgi:hypothetical protein